MPALLTTQSMRPKWSIATLMMALAPIQVETLSVLATASPPLARISFTTCCAGPASLPSPLTDAPMSLTTTLAPSAAISNANSRPMPPPEPVTTTTLSCIIFAILDYPDVGMLKCRSRRHARRPADSMLQNAANAVIRRAGSGRSSCAMRAA